LTASGSPSESVPFGLASSLTNVSEWPFVTVGMHGLDPGEVMSPGRYVNPAISTCLRPQSLNLLRFAVTYCVPPWSLFSGRCPCVTAPRSSSLCVKGSTPVWSLNASQTTMMPIDSYHEARLVS
jgi:hypothetical protein